MKQKQTQKKVGDLMGGKVLDLDIIKLIGPVTSIFGHWLIAFERSIAY